MIFLIDHLYFQHPENTEIQWSYVLLPNKNALSLSCPLTSITRNLKYLRTLFQFLTSSCFVLEMHFVSTSPSILKTPASPFNEFDQPRFKEISMQSNLEENFFYVIAQFLKLVNQARKIEHSQFFLLCYNAFLIWAYKNKRIFTCTMIF